MAISMLITSVTGFLLWIVVARRMDTDQVAALTGIVNSFLLVSAFAQLSLNLGLNRYLPTAGAGSKKLVLISYVTIFVSTLVFSFVFVLTPLGATVRDELAVPVLSIFGLALIWGIFALQDQVLASLGRAPWIPVENTAYSVVRFCLIFALSGAGVGAALAAWWAPAALAVVVVTALLWWKVLPAAGRQHTALPSVRQFAKYVSVNYLSTLLATMFYSGLPILVLNSFGPTVGAAFAIAWVIIQTGDNTVSRYGTSLVISVSLDSSKTRSSVTSLMKLWLLALPGLAVLVVFAPQILSLFGPQYAEIAGQPLRLLLIAFAFRMLMIVQTSVWRAQDKNWLVAVAYFGQVAPAVICLVAGVVDSLMGLAWVITISQVLVALAMLPSLRRSLRGDPSRGDGRPNDHPGEIPVGARFGAPLHRENSQPEGATP
jgi:O-antigen/teichoic acid export membrane protein